MKLIFLAGLPGVGKTTLAKAVAARRSFTYLSAGSLIATALQSRGRDELKEGAVLDNQALLVEGFRKATRGVQGAILLDGHVMVRGERELVIIPEKVFRLLGCDHLVVLTNDPIQIAANRTRDSARTRLPQTIEELEDDQIRMVARVNELAGLLGCSSTEIPLDHFGQAVATLESVLSL